MPCANVLQRPARQAPQFVALKVRQHGWETLVPVSGQLLNEPFARGEAPYPHATEMWMRSGSTLCGLLGITSVVPCSLVFPCC